MMLTLADDAALLAPREMAARLAELTAGGTIEPDYYGVGGPVTALETEIAALLGKEAAVMYPTGTLANLMAARLTAGGRPGARLVVHRDSHAFNDAGDDFTHSAEVTMVPLSGGNASFSAAQLRAEIARTASARVPARIAAVMIETPNRRHANLRFDPGDEAEIVALARAEGIPLILDAARIFIEAAWRGSTPAEIAAPYDFVYLSLYKYLDAPFGAVLAGPGVKLEGQNHERRRYGGGLYQMWPAALLARHALPRQAAAWQSIRQHGEAVFAALAEAGLQPFRHPLDSNLLRLPRGAPEEGVMNRARAAGIRLPPPAPECWTVKMNDSWLAFSPEHIARELSAIFAGPPTAA